LQSAADRYHVRADEGYGPVADRDCAPRNPGASLDILTSSRDSSLASSSVPHSGCHGNLGRKAISVVANAVYGRVGILVLSNTVDQDFAAEG
jgi:hypothetical protein